MDNCPTCKRTLETILDFPSVVLKAVEVRKMPDVFGAVRGLHSPDGEQTPSVPDAVKTLFAGKPDDFKGMVEYEGRRWVRFEGINMSDVINNLPTARSAYWYSLAISQNEFLGPYIKQLQGLIGKETPRAVWTEIFDGLQHPRITGPDFPDGLSLSFHSPERCFMRRYSHGKVTIDFSRIGIAMTKAEIDAEAVLVLEYEGRLFTVEEQVRRGKNG